MKDILYATRLLARSPGFTLVAVITLALGIGANTAIFSVVSRALLADLPYADPERLVMVWERNFPRDRKQNVVSPANLLDWQAQNSVFEGLAAVRDSRMNLTGEGEPEEIRGQGVLGNYFQVLGARAAAGRTLTPADAAADGPAVVVLSHRLWQRRFGADPSVVGRSLALDGRPYRVIGVMPPAFRPVGQAEFWVPFRLDPSVDYRKRTGRYLGVIGKLKAGVSIDRAQTQMSLIARRLEQAHPEFNKGWGVNLVPLYDQLTQDTRPALLVLSGAVGFLLLIACANVANLLLARSARRERELAIRSSLGAGRARLVRQLLTETTLLSLAGGCLGWILGVWGVDALLAAAPPTLEPLAGTELDYRVFGFTALVSVLTGLLAGLAPAFSSTRFDLSHTLKEGARGVAGSGRGNRLRSAFVVAQVSLSMVLLAGAGLMIRSFSRLQSVDPGFRPEKILTLQVGLPGFKYREEHRRVAFFRETAAGMSRLPGVRAASGIVFLPFSGPGSATSFAIAGRPPQPPGQNFTCDVRIVLPGYFRTMGIPLLSGRDFTERDTAEAPRTFVINETFTRRHWPGENPLGKQIVVNMMDELPGEIVGVVGDTRHAALDAEIREMVYYSYPHLTFPFMNFVLRAESDPEALIRPATAVIRSLDPDQPVSEVRTMEAWIGRTTAAMRFRMLLLSVFSGLALALAALGVYGVISYAVAQRTHEMGVRMALGAGRPAILWGTFRHGGALILLGTALGLAGASGLTRLLKGLLYEVHPGDPATLALGGALMVATALLACAVPAWRATRIDPVAALRIE